MTSRTPLRNDDVQRAQDTQRPLNETVRDLSGQLQSLPRRQQAWLRFTCRKGDGPFLAGQLIKGPPYAIASVQVLAVQSISSSSSLLTAAPWLTVEPVDGVPNTVRIVNAFGLPDDGTFDLLAEFVENVAPPWLRTNMTGGAP